MYIVLKLLSFLLMLEYLDSYRRMHQSKSFFNFLYHIDIKTLTIDRYLILMLVTSVVKIRYSTKCLVVCLTLNFTNSHDQKVRLQKFRCSSRRKKMSRRPEDENLRTARPRQESRRDIGIINHYTTTIYSINSTKCVERMLMVNL